ncbi:molecular chaperone [Vibrio breoganii]
MKKFLFSLLLLLTSSELALAYQVTPMYLEMEYVGRKAQASYQVTNNSSQPVMIEVLVRKVKIESDSNLESSENAEQDFLILPPQAVVEPNSVRRFRVRYLGDGEISATQTYRVLFEQIQTSDGTEDDTQVKFLFNFSTIAFVSPTPDKCTRTINAKVEESELVLRNEGNCVLNIGQATLFFSQNGSTTEKSWSELSFENSSNYLIPQLTKRYKLPPGLINSVLVDISMN